MEAEKDKPPPAAPAEDRCTFFLRKKKRLCKLQRVPRHLFCGEHLVHAPKDEDSEKARIPCPLNPQHSVYSHNLESHLRICNSREVVRGPYHVKKVNAGDMPESDRQPDTLRLSDISNSELEGVLAKMDAMSREWNVESSFEEVVHESMRADLLEARYGPAALKHLRQQASILGWMERWNLLDEDEIILEFGAGRGKLSHYVQRAVPSGVNVHFFLVDRASQRYRWDCYHRDQLNYSRIKLDIQDLDLQQLVATVDPSSPRPVVAVSKHLCGAATDLAIRCVDKYLASKSGRVKGLAIALCCHHQCSWRDLVGKEFLEPFGIDARSFLILRNLTSWATCATRRQLELNDEQTVVATEPNAEQAVAAAEPTVEQTKAAAESNAEQGAVHQLGLTPEERELIGIKAKAIINQVRVLHLQRLGFNVSLRQYVDRSVTLENVLLLASMEA